MALQCKKTRLGSFLTFIMAAILKQIYLKLQIKFLSWDWI
jgi:hypothetical protein